MALTWNTKTLPSSTGWAAIAYGAGLVVAINDYGSTDSVAAVSDDNGDTWTEYPMPDTDVASWFSIAYDGTVFCALGRNDSANLISTTSVDGQTWTAPVDLGVATLNPSALGASGSLFFCCSRDTGAVANKIFVSSDHGASWTVRKVLTADGRQAALGAAARGGTMLLAGAADDNSAGYTYTSIDSGITWTEHAAPANFPDGTPAVKALVASTDFFIAFANTGTVATSPDGVTWTARAGLGASGNFPGVAAIENIVVVVDSSTGDTYYSADGGVTFAADTTFPSAPPADGFYAGCASPNRMFFPSYDEDNIAVSDALPYLVGMADTVGVGMYGDGIASALLSSGFGVADLSVAGIIKTITEHLAFGEILSPKRHQFSTLTDELAYNDALAVAWRLAIEEGVGFAGEAARNVIKLAAIVDTLAALGVVTNRVDAVAALSTVLSVNALLATGWHMSAIDTVEFQEALEAQLRAVTTLVDSAAFGATPAPAIRITAVLSDAMEVGDDIGTALRAFESLSEEILFYTTLRLGDAEYAGWVLNQGAVSEYRNYPFNGFIRFEGKYYGTADDGLYLLEGNTDAGDPIDAWVTTALMDFGTGKLKRIPDVYLGFAGGSSVVLKVITTHRGVQTEHHYTATVPAGEVMHPAHIKIGRGLKSVYWQFALCNVAGGDLDLDHIQWRPLILDRRL